VPVAINCWVAPTGMVGMAGVTAMEVKNAAVTARVVLPVILPWVAAMVTAPATTPVTKPLVSIWVTDISDEPQLTCVVISKLVPSE